MALNLGSRASWAIALVLCASTLWAAGQAGASFADAAGFSGKTGGQTCMACHTVTHPAQAEAKAQLDGLPAAWLAGQSYHLRVSVTGGPPAMPAPQPQGGFDLQSDGGLFVIPAGSQLMRTPNPQEVTYLPAGTLQRSWEFDWVAPALVTPPVPVNFWLAVVAANGNHVIASNASDQGELFDSADALKMTVAPDAGELAAWAALPLAPPSVELVVDGRAMAASGTLGDPNATRLHWRLDDEAWNVRESTLEWNLRLLGLPAGDHVLSLRTEGAGRSSSVIAVEFRIDSPSAQLIGRHEARANPLPAALAALAFSLTIIIAHQRRPSP